MDEVDGRPGPVAATIGHLDALTDALPPFVRLMSPQREFKESDVRGGKQRARQEARWGFCPGCCQTPDCRTAAPRLVSPSAFYIQSRKLLPPQSFEIPSSYPELMQFNIGSTF